MQTSENLLVRPLGFSNADGIISSAGLKQTDFTQKIFRTSFVREVCVIYWWRKIPLEFYGGRKESWLWIEAENFSHFSFTLCGGALALKSPPKKPSNKNWLLMQKRCENMCLSLCIILNIRTTFLALLRIIILSLLCLNEHVITFSQPKLLTTIGCSRVLSSIWNSAEQIF